MILLLRRIWAQSGEEIPKVPMTFRKAGLTFWVAASEEEM
jgi:hypothetical protein